MASAVQTVCRGGVAAVLLLLAGPGSGQEAVVAQSIEHVALPRPTGPHPVGRRVFSILDSTRTDPQAIRADGKREFMLLVWYPAVAESVAANKPWIPAIWADSAASDLYMLSRHATVPPTIAEIRAIIHTTTSWAQDSAAVAPDGGRFPVLIFSPGNVTMPGYYSSLGEELAS